MEKKRYQGALNDKDRSKQKLIQAVGIVIQDKGYTGLTVTNISKAAGLDRKLIKLYFGSVDNLIEIYVKSKDYWVAATGDAGIMIENNQGKDTKQILKNLLLNQLDYFYENEEMQKIVLWQISQRSQIMYQVCEEREQLSSTFFALTDKELKGNDVDLRAIAGLLVAGIYYMVLHAKTTDSLFCEIDINNPEGMKRIKEAISLVLEYAYSNKTQS
ncbi:TetR/AcrR family transcriptional regulator [Pedobacter panaciterrae]|jgi:Transcriptional regulator|uniref:TetR/AcrR family transcriptional regulator n=1 Tax=Pedobacter panaciterrae TaxID=363849 RepID=A0ABU8NLI0_9SPHI|nr:TetR/AcrR family transcriptional regulator [Pedobacter panaciterrae]NQX52715.1 TetR/AcrR family transcriptional regulator [Pedobacter panaciterrae]